MAWLDRGRGARPGADRRRAPELRPSADPRRRVPGSARRQRAGRLTPRSPSALRDDQRAWHLAAAAVGPDEHAAAELERVGQSAAARRAFGPAAAAFERAARLSRDAELAARRLLAAGQAAAAAGAPRARARRCSRRRRARPRPPGSARAPSTCAGGSWRGAERRRTRPRCSSARRSGSPLRTTSSPRRCSPTPPTAAWQANDYLRAEELARRAAVLLAEGGEAAERVPGAGDARLGARAARKGRRGAPGAARGRAPGVGASTRSARSGRGCTCCCAR